MVYTKNLILVCTGRDTGYAAKHGIPVLHLCLGITPTGALQRLQLSSVLLESDRIKKLIDGHILPLGDFGTGKAVLVCAEPEYMDLALGMDFSIGYSEMKDFNHVFRLMETAALRIKNPEAIVVFE